MIDRRAPMALSLVLVAGIVVGVLMAVSNAMSGRYGLLGLLLGAVGTYLVVMGRRYQFPGLLVLSVLSGRGLVLGGFGYWDAFATALAAGMLVRVCLTPGQGKRMIGRFTWLLIAGYCSILIGHFVANLIGVGTGSEGGVRLTVASVALLVTGYFILTDRLPMTFLNRVPWLGLIPGFFEAALEAVNFLWPTAFVVTYALYSDSLNWEMIQAAFSGRDITRPAGFRALGLAIGLLCSVQLTRLPRLVSLRSVLSMAGLLLAFALVLVAGYRSYLMALFTVAGAALFMRSRALGLMGASCVLLLLTGLSLYNAQVAPLPLPVQRTLCWFPGDWDSTTAREAREGLEWRHKVWTSFMWRSFPQHPWVGQGVRYFPREALGRTLSQEEVYALFQSTHSGFFSALDYVGMVGTALLILATLRALYNCRVLMRRKSSQIEPWVVWVMLYFLSLQSWYWLTGSFSTSYMTLSVCMLALEVARRRAMPAPDGDAGQPATETGARGALDPARLVAVVDREHP
jgi:hypothetical protein